MLRIPTWPIPQESLLHERLVEQLLKDDTIGYGSINSDFTEWELKLTPVLLDSAAIAKFAKHMKAQPYFLE